MLAKLAVKKIRQFVKRKAKASLKSSTMGVAAGIVALAGWLQANPEVVNAVAGDWAGVTMAAIGLAVAIARLRTAGKDDG